MTTKTDEAIREKERSILESFGFECTPDMGGTYWEKKLSDGSVFYVSGYCTNYDNYDRVLGLPSMQVSLEHVDSAGTTLKDVTVREQLDIHREQPVTEQRLNAFLNQLT